MRNRIFLGLALFLCQLSLAEGTHGQDTGESSSTDTTVVWNAVKIVKATRAVEEVKEALESVPRATVFEFDLKYERKNILEKITQAQTMLKDLEPKLYDAAGQAKWTQLSNDFNALLKQSLSTKTILGNPNRLKVLDTKYHYYFSPPDIEEYFLSGKNIK